MGASNRDIALTIIANGERSHYSSVKAIGNLIWDTRLGIFSGAKPKAWSALRFIGDTNWGDCTLCLDQPLLKPVYGTVTIDFDRKEVVDANGWGSSDRTPYAWLEQSVHDAIAGGEGVLAGPSLLEHLKSGRIQLTAGLSTYGKPLQFDTLERARDALSAMQQAAFSSGRMLTFAHLTLPSDWKMVHAIRQQ